MVTTNDKICLACIGITIAIIWVIVHPISFFITLFIIIVIYLIYRTYKNKKIREERIFEEKQRAEERIFEEKQRAKGLVKYKGKWATPEKVKKWKKIDIGLSSNFAKLSSYQFEEFIAKLFQKMGYITTRTPSTGDFGADVIAKKRNKTILIEVKKYMMGNNVTPKEVQRTLGAMWKYKADKAVFITTSDFTVRAKEIEKEAPIELWDKRIFHEMVRKYFIDKD